MKLKITLEAYEKIMALVRECPAEIAGMARLNKDKIIDDVAIAKQEVTAGSVDHDTDDLMSFFESRRTIGDSDLWRIQWHSHNNFGAFHSGVDTNAIEEFGRTTDWLISLVFNKDAEVVGRLDLFKPWRLTLNTIELDIQYPHVDQTEWATNLIEAKVTTPAPVTHFQTAGQYRQLTNGVWHYLKRDDCQSCHANKQLPHAYLEGEVKLSKNKLKKLRKQQEREAHKIQRMTDDEWAQYNSDGLMGSRAYGL